MQTITEHKISEAEKRIINQLIYYSIFRYPLKREELDMDASHTDLIEKLTEQSLIHRLGDFYSISADTSWKINRIEGNAEAQSYYPKAQTNSALIFAFPFVKGVYISGSLSKGHMPKDGDIDYFIICKPGKLWLARTLLILYKKFFLLNSRKYFCVNYFIDADHLEIEEQNRFTATELTTLLPMLHDGIHPSFIQKNQWVGQYFKHQHLNGRKLSATPRPLIKRLLEGLLNNPFGSMLDYSFMHFTIKYWKRKFPDFHSRHFDVALKSRSYVSKHHPRNFQQKVLDEFERKQKAFERQHGINLTST